MTIELEAEALRRVPMFQSVSARSLELLALLASVERFAPGEMLCRIGEASDCVFVILSGEADVLIGEAAARRAVARLGEHQVVGEIAALCEVPRTADVIAITDIAAMRIDRDLLLEMFAQTPEMAVSMMRELARRLHATTQALAVAQAGELD